MLFQLPMSATFHLRCAAALILAAGIALTGCAATSTPETPQLSLSTSSLTFASTYTGLSSAAQTITVTNSGNAALDISSIAIAGDYSQTSTDCSTVLPAGTCQIAVTFAPTAIGTRTGQLTLSSNASGGTSTVTLTGTGALGTPAVTLSPGLLNFSSIVVGVASAAQVVTVTNTGTAVLTISALAATGDFSQTSNGCNLSLAINATCNVSVTFTPTAAGSRAGTLNVSSNATPATATVALNGAGYVSSSYAGPAFQVLVEAGTTPITGAAVQLYASGTKGNGSTPTGLLAVPVTTNASGVASIAGYYCPSTTSLLYAVGLGGTVAGASSPNANIALMTPIGSCNGIVAGTKFAANEATTIAAVESLAQFYAVGGQIGATSSNSIGLANAFATAATLTDPIAGTSPGSTLPATAVSPAPRVNSLANLLNACVVSTSACATLYNNTAQGSAKAANTLDAAYYLAKSPAANVAALYAQSLASSAYSPALAQAPTDWTMFVTYSGGGLNSPAGLGVDSTGSLWVASYFGSATKFSPIGAPAFPNGITGAGLNNSFGLAIDLNNNVWIPNEQPFTAAGIGTVSELSSAGASLAGAGYANGGMNYPLSVAIDPNGTVWVVDYGNSHITLLNPAGNPISGTSGYTTPLFAFPVAVAVDANHFGWIVNESSNAVTKVAPDGSSFINYSCCDLASGIAIDQGDNIWVADYFGNSVSLLTNAGTVISSSYTGAGSIYHPQGIAIDGAGSVWVANYRATYLTELSGSTSAVPGSSISPASGFGADAGLLEAYALAIDASGNLWVSNQGSNTVTKFIGMAVPVKTPLSGLPQLP